MSFFVEPTGRDYVCSRNGIWRIAATFTRNGVVTDLTGWRIVMQLRDKPDNTPTDPPARLTINTDGVTVNGSGILVPSPATGAWVRYISNADLLALPLATKSDAPKIFAYDVVFHEPSPGTDFCPVLNGSFQVDPGVTYA